MRLWITAAVLLGIAVLGLAMVPRTIDWNAHRPTIEAAASQLSGHDVVISGPIKITLLPRPLLTAKDVAITDRTEEGVGFGLSANQADVALEIGPLLAGRPVVSDLKLKRPVLTVESESSRKLLSWPPRWQDWAAPFLKLDLKSISIADGKIDLASDRPEPGVTLSDLSLQLRINKADGPLEAVGLFKTKRHSFTMTADFARPDSDGVSASKLTIEARNGVDETTTLRFNGGMRPFGDDRGLSGRLRLIGPDLQHGLAAIAAATGYPGTFHSIGKTQPFAVEGRIEADRAGIRADDLQLRLAEKLGKASVNMQLHPQRRLNLDLELPTLRLADDAILGNFLPLDLLSKLQVPPGEIDVRLREIVYRGGAARQAGLKLTTGQDRVTKVEQAKAQLPGLVDVQFEGRLYAGSIGPRLKGRLAAVGDNLRSSLEWLRLIDDSDDEGSWRSFSFESDVDVTSVEIALSAIDMRLDSSKLEGSANLRFSERLQAAMNVDIDRLNLDLYTARSDRNDVLTRLTDGLRNLDADIEARFKRLIWQAVHVEEGSISASADGGELRLDKIALKTVGDTALLIDGQLDLNTRSTDLRATLSSQHPVRMLHHLELDLPLSSSRLQPIALAGQIEGTLDRFTLNIEADYDQGDAAIDGQAGWVDGQPWYDLRIDVVHPDHQALASQFRLAPLLPAGDARGGLELAGKLRREATTSWVASGNAKLGPTTFTGSLAYQPETPNGNWEAKLSVGTPKRDSLAPFLILAGLRFAGDWTPSRWLGRLPSTGLRTSWLEKIEGSLSLASKGGLAGEGLGLTAKLSDGLLYVDRLEASIWQGELQAEFSLERRREQPFFAIALDLEDVEASALARWLGVRSGVRGPLDLHVEASSVGRTPFEMVAGLAGDLEVDAGPGELKGLGIPTLRQALASKGPETAPVDRSLSLPFDTLEAKGGLSRGILSFEDARLVTDPASGEKSEAIIDGTVDLLLWVVDLTLSADSAAPNPAPGSEPRLYRVVGPPDRPNSFISAGN